MLNAVSSKFSKFITVKNIIISKTSHPTFSLTFFLDFSLPISYSYLQITIMNLDFFPPLIRENGTMQWENFIIQESKSSRSKMYGIRRNSQLNIGSSGPAVSLVYNPTQTSSLTFFQNIRPTWNVRDMPRLTFSKLINILSY